VSGRGVARLALAALLAAAWAGASCAAAAQFLWIRNVWRQDAFLNIEPGYVTATDVMDGWQSAQWIFIDAPNGYAWIQNRWTGCYLHIERGKVECSTDVQRGWHSAQWSGEAASGKSFRLRNRWKNCYLNIERGPVACTRVAAGWQSALWTVED
jgi:hypothetical protein